ncbi:hypothetical protein PACILC2_22800 [Paenibacillus cisolokensis]|uniref:Uncharacterized protein n=1 Tax=Paenibacillus cisolokensis TaxID=1658519 RepID=A0ABQ4N6C2_9BACL|nr:hypothetical protein [Paenibacillus cisolokensis]GIQ63712.1 hypothetical protein PACILC2_22800 [Paenibacillus cisolokensis]
MAKYKASPNYAIQFGNKTIKFGWLGDYETEDAAEIKALDALVPHWIKRVDEPKPEVNVIPDEEEKPEKPQKGRKSSGK